MMSTTPAPRASPAVSSTMYKLLLSSRILTLYPATFFGTEISTPSAMSSAISTGYNQNPLSPARSINLAMCLADLIYLESRMPSVKLQL